MMLRLMPAPGKGTVSESNGHVLVSSRSLLSSMQGKLTLNFVLAKKGSQIGCMWTPSEPDRLDSAETTACSPTMQSTPWSDVEQSSLHVSSSCQHQSRQQQAWLHTLSEHEPLLHNSWDYKNVKAAGAPYPYDR